MSVSTRVSEGSCAGVLGEVRRVVPLVQCLTNIVVAQWTANVLLAIGAAPAMVDNPEEAGPFATVAGGVLVNLGTPYHDTAAAMAKAVDMADGGTPWVLDPVAAGVLAWRTQLAFSLLESSRPTVIRGNASEIMALAGGVGGKGVDAVDTPESALPHAMKLAKHYKTVVAVSGPVDHITDGERVVRINNGHVWLTRVTGAGCALGAVMAGFAAVVDDPLLAAVAGTAAMTVAAEEAAARSHGPGSFAVALVDELANLSSEVLAAKARLS